LDQEVLKTLKADPRRTVTFPDAADAAKLRAVYQAAIEQYAQSGEHNRALLARVRTELAKLRGSE
jgi:hypothetical protein